MNDSLDELASEYVLGTLFYAALLFGGFELLRRRLPVLHAQTA